MMAARLHPAAEDDLLHALEYYEQQRHGLGGELRRDFESTLGKVRLNPQSYAVVDASGIRYASFHRFPYRLVFLELGDHLWIVAVSPHSRHPRYWSGRVNP